uniref:RpsU-divergently transcribed n=1 Tax=uncultured bacterium 5H7 TaxID=1701327 RepID=A0A0N9HMN5_9BACT|nr:RpsU-divergently transcribed [uncultured bacterium 5H7]
MALADLTLPELRLALAPAIARAAVFDGWSEAAVDAAALDLGIAPAAARLAFPGGAADMIGAWIERIDADAALTLPQQSLAGLRVPERIRRLVEFRIDAVTGREEALRRALAILAMPQNIAAAARFSWSSADLMWRLAGDTATDFNHYSKRAILASLVAATLAVLIDDRSEGRAETRAFLDRRLQDVARFEKAKARLRRDDAEHFSLVRLLGRLRYPAR